MSSKTSILSLFVLVLATCCYSLPVEDQFHSSTLPTPIHEYSTGITIVEHAVNVNMRLITPEESSDIPNIHSEHKYGEHHSEYMPTDEVSRPSRLSEEISSTFTTQSPSSVHLTHDERSFNDFSFTTMESKTQFNERSINGPGLNWEEETIQSERYFPDQERQLEMTTVVSEPREFTTSADSFGKFTGLLTDDHKEKRTPSMYFAPLTTTIKFEKEDQSVEETSSKPEQLVKTFSLIPGEITETKIFDNEASKAYFMRQPEQQQQLSQGQKQPIIKTQESDN
jgi:hypothetical protein